MGKDRRSAFDTLSLRCCLDIQVEMLSKQLDVQVWSLGERTGLKILILESLAYRGYIKS